MIRVVIDYEAFAILSCNVFVFNFNLMICIQCMNIYYGKFVEI